MLLFTGEYELTLDEKYRLSIPSRVREQVWPGDVSEGFYLIPGANRVLCLYPEVYFQRLALAGAPRKVALDEKLAYERVNFGLASRVELDRQGRVLLGEKSVKRAHLKEQVTLVGVRDHLEIWDRAVWDKYVEDQMVCQEEVFLQVREEALGKERETAGM